MTNDSSGAQRQLLLQVTSAMTAPCAPVAATGKPGDFDFLTGHWNIAHRRLKDQQWISFDGGATVYGILGGVISVEELRIPSQHFSGMGLRVLDVRRALWADYWVNSRTGVLGAAPTWGSFVDGVGCWDAPDVDAGQAIIVRGVWDQITARSCRWRQAVSRDAGHTWDENWVMQWQRVA